MGWDGMGWDGMGWDRIGCVGLTDTLELAERPCSSTWAGGGSATSCVAFVALRLGVAFKVPQNRSLELGGHPSCRQALMSMCAVQFACLVATACVRWFLSHHCFGSLSGHRWSVALTSSHPSPLSWPRNPRTAPPLCRRRHSLSSPLRSPPSPPCCPEPT